MSGGREDYDGKKVASIFVPAFIDNINDEFNKNVYGNIIKILRCMKSTDEGVVEYFTLSADKKTGNLSGRQICHIEYFDKINVDHNINLIEWQQQLNEHIWKIVDSFYYMYNQVVKWTLMYDKLPSENLQNIEETNLGKWCSMKRHLKNKGTLDEKIISKLEEISHWHWSIDNSFYTRFADLEEWIKNNDGNLPQRSSEDKNEKSLGIWCSRQRVMKNELCDDFIKKLESLSIWNWGHYDIFNKRCHKLKDFVRINNRMPAPHSKNIDEKKLGCWCGELRGKQKKGILSKNMIETLEKIDLWFWTTIIITSHEDNYQELIKFVADNNKLPSKSSKNDIERRVALWCGGQRKKYKKNKLNDDQIKKFESIDDWFWKRKLL